MTATKTPLSFQRPVVPRDRASRRDFRYEAGVCFSGTAPAPAGEGAAPISKVADVRQHRPEEAETAREHPPAAEFELRSMGRRASRGARERRSGKKAGRDHKKSHREILFARLRRHRPKVLKACSNLRDKST